MHSVYTVDEGLLYHWYLRIGVYCGLRARIVGVEVVGVRCSINLEHAALK